MRRSEPARSGDAAWFPAVLAVLTLAAFALRLWLAMNTTWLWDEEREWIPLARAISFDPAALYLPLRTDYHGALAAYPIRAGAAIFGDAHWAWRLSAILSGTATVPMLGLIARTSAGPVAGLAAAAFLTFSEYHIAVSATAIQMATYLLLSAVAVWAFQRYLAAERPRDVWIAAIFGALAFLTYEIGALLAPVFLLTALLPAHRHLYRRAAPWLAALGGLALILPDVLTSLTHARAGADALGGTYGGLLDRFGSLGLKPQFLAFYLRDGMEALWQTVLRRPLTLGAAEYVAMNSLTGAAVLGAVAVALFGAMRGRSGQRFAGLHLILFVLVLGFFLLIKPPPGNPVSSWLWVSVTILPGLVLLSGLATRGVAGKAVLGVLALSAGLSLWGLQGNYGLERQKIMAAPELLTAADGTMVAVTFHRDACDLCDASPTVTLADVRVEGTDSSAAGGPDVAGAETGTDDRDFALRVADDGVKGAWMARVYEAYFDVTDRSGATERLTANVHVPRHKTLAWPGVFWID